MTASLLVGCDSSSAQALPVSATAATVPADESSKVTSEPLFRLQRVCIPSTSAHRAEGKDWDSNSPPDLYLTIERNGDPLGAATEAKEGWDVEFSASKAENRFTIDDVDGPSYSVKLFDHDTTDPDDVILTISGLKAADFAKPIREPLSSIDPPDRAVIIYFTPVK